MQMKAYKDKRCPLFYIDETWVDRNLDILNMSAKITVMCIHASVNSGNRLLMMHVIGINGYLPNVQQETAVDK